MEAKDRIIKYDKSECPAFWQGIIDAALRDQDEISFKAGIKEENQRIFNLITIYGLKAFLLEKEKEIDKKVFGKSSSKNKA